MFEDEHNRKIKGSQTKQEYTNRSQGPNKYNTKTNKARGMTKQEKTKEEKIIIQSRAEKTMRWSKQHGPNQRRQLQTKQNKDKQNNNSQG